MDINFKDIHGNRVGYINGNDIKDNYGNRVGMIVGDDIKDNYGNRAGMLSGNDVKDNYGNRVAMIIGSDIKDNYGNRIGYPVESASNKEIAAAALLLFNLASSSVSSNSPDTDIPYQDNYNSDKHGCGYIFGFLISIFRFLIKSWGGRIGVIIGVIFIIFSYFHSGGGGDILNILFTGILICIVLGLIGAGIGAIVGLIGKLIKKLKK